VDLRAGLDDLEKRKFLTLHLLSGAGAIGQLVADVPSGPRMTQPQVTKEKVYIGIMPSRQRQKLSEAQHHTNKTKTQ
jgi:hypothetical protein